MAEYQFKDTVNGIHITYKYEEMLENQLDTTRIECLYKGLLLRVIKSHEKGSMWEEPEIDGFALKDLRKVLHILHTLDIEKELAKCKKCDPFRLSKHHYCKTPIIEYEDDSEWPERENISFLYSKVPDKKYDGVGAKYVLTTSYYFMKEYDDIKEKVTMTIIFNKNGKILKTMNKYETKFDIKAEIAGFLAYCKEKGVK